MGKELQDSDRTHYRGILSIINHKFCQITCPTELLSYCRKYNFEITKKKTLDQLDKDDVAIILIKGPDDLWGWHWITYPKYSKSYISDFFEGPTKIKAVYILNEKKEKETR